MFSDLNSVATSGFCIKLSNGGVGKGNSLTRLWCHSPGSDYYFGAHLDSFFERRPPRLFVPLFERLFHNREHRGACAVEDSLVQDPISPVFAENQWTQLIVC